MLHIWNTQCIERYKEVENKDESDIPCDQKKNKWLLYIRVDFTKNITKDKENNFIMIKQSIY